MDQMVKPLFGKKIVITRDHLQSTELIKKINVLGGKCESYPTIKICPPSNWQKCDAIIAKLNDFDWIIFSSVNAVKFFIQRFLKNQIDKYSGKVGAIGRQTQIVLEKNGWFVDFVPDYFSAEGFVAQFNDINLTGKKILLPGSAIARKELAAGLTRFGAQVQKITVYRTICSVGDKADKISKSIFQKKIDAILFFSPSAVNCFYEIMGESVIKMIIKNKIVIGAIGDTTANSLKKIGLQIQIIPEESTQQGLLDYLVDYFNSAKILE